MNKLFSSDEHGPVTWMGGRPVYAAHILAAGFAATMVVTALLSAFNLGSVLAGLAFSSPEVLRGEVWRILTYGLVNPPSIWFAVELLMIVWFGQEVEKFFGRRKFLALYAGLYVIPPLFLTLLGLWGPRGLVGESVSFALFIAFATLYPNAQLLFGLLAKWVAWILLGIYALQSLGAHDWLGLVSLGLTAGFAWAFVLWQMGRIALPSFGALSRGSPPRPAAERSEPSRSGSRGGAAQEIDAILDKISRSGLDSLSPQERARLDALREKLRGGPGR